MVSHGGMSAAGKALGGHGMRRAARHVARPSDPTGEARHTNLWGPRRVPPRRSPQPAPAPLPAIPGAPAPQRAPRAAETEEERMSHPLQVGKGCVWQAVCKGTRVWARQA